MIQLENLSFQYRDDDRMAVDGINLTVPDGDFLGIIGESGAGKSTLSYAINGIIPHHYKGDYYGHVKVNGLDTFENELSTLALHVGSVFQDIDSQMVASVVDDEIMFGLENFGIPKEEIETRIVEALNEIGISHLRYRDISSLSGGQKQKVAIAAITALRPSILLLDEPTGELDPRSSRQIFQMLKRLNETHHMTIVVIEQKIMLLCEFAKRLAVMSEGKLVYCDTVREVLKEADSLEQIGINCPRVVTLCRDLRRRGLLQEEIGINVAETEQLIRNNILKNDRLTNKINELRKTRAEELYMTQGNQYVEQQRDEPETHETSAFVQFQQVSFGYSKDPVVKEVSFQLSKGEFVALVGENGAGKSTLSKLFNGLHRPMSGDVIINGMNTKNTKSSVLASTVGFLFQNPDRQICQNTIRDEIMFGLRCVSKDETIIKERTERTLQSFGLKGEDSPFSLSRGERQRVVLASLIAVEPKLLILDEPTTGLDYRECMHIMTQIQELNAKGVTVVMVCHDMEVVLDFAQRVLVLSEGRIIADGTTRDIFRDAEVMKKASLLPPQIMELTQRLGDEFDGISREDELVDRILLGMEVAV